MNTEGFVQEDGSRAPLPMDMAVGTVRIRHREDGRLDLAINGTRLDLFPLKNGLAALEWNPDGTKLLHAIDILALSDRLKRKDVPAWGADVAWPGAGQARLVLFPLGDNGFSGFLISRPGNKTVVRQMEFRQVFGPANRPDAGSSADKSGS